MNSSHHMYCVAVLVAALALDAAAEESDDDEAIVEITVSGTRLPATRPAGTYQSIATTLRFDPLAELQPRGLPEGQADVTVRGGLFENTGFRLGAVTIMDPQTGHYVAGLPIDPSLISSPTLLTGVDNAIAGFNSNVATVNYAIPEIRHGGTVLLGAGNGDLLFGSIRVGGVYPAEIGDLAAAASVAGSEGDGTVAFGDHDFQRYNLRLQYAADHSHTDLILAYQDKFYGWPGAYTGFASLPETDQTKTTLVIANHRAETDAGWWQASAFHRRLDNDYDFDRTTQETGVPGSFEHETAVWGIGMEAILASDAFDWHIAGQLTSDDLVRSTDLTSSNFTSRNYAKLSLGPAKTIERPNGNKLTFKLGGTVDYSSEDASAFSPILGVTLETSGPDANKRWLIEYAATSQVPGYTALGSGPSGLFGGNADLGREKSRQLLLSYEHLSLKWNSEVSLFYRQDRGLVDWTFDSRSPFARRANAVDIDIVGIETSIGRTWNSVALNFGYVYLDKQADYGAADVDASFYALNFAPHRATLALRYRAGERFELSLHSEYREQEENPLRSSSNQALVVSAAAEWRPKGADGFNIAIAADNLTGDDFEQFPGTPAIGRQVSVSVSYDW